MPRPPAFALWLASLAILACDDKSPTTSPESPTAATPIVDPATTPESEPETSAISYEHPSACVDDLSAEMPVETRESGDGDRYLRVENSTEAELRARILDVDGQPVMAGTLLVPAGGNAQFLVGAGQFQLRLREENHCSVLMGEPFEIREEVRGVAITIAFEYGPDGAPLGMQAASGEL